MKNAFSYAASIILSVLLVFFILALAVSGIVRLRATDEQFMEISEKYELSDKVCSELENYFHERSSSTGIPENVFMDAIDNEYIDSVIDTKIKNGFLRLKDKPTEPDIENEALETSIDSFFREYADSINYTPDDKFEKKLESTKNNAYSIINEYSDVYKFGALEEHGVIGTLSKIYKRIDIIIAVSASAIVILLMLLLIINHDPKIESVYWAGVSAVVAGVIGAAPCIFLLATDFFRSFSIKQPQIYTAYTETMKLFTNTFMYTSIGIAAAGLLLTIIYAVAKPKNKQ